MTLPSDWKNGKFLEWNTELPFQGRPRQSPVFVIQNTECYFELIIQRAVGSIQLCYALYLKPKLIDVHLKSFNLTVVDDSSIPGRFCRHTATFRSASTSLYSFYESSISDRGMNLSHGYFVRFFICFENEPGPLLPFEKIIDEKTTQADLMPTLQADIEHLSLDFGKLLKIDDHSDVQLQCKGGSIPAHRSILAARSKAFSDMFRPGTSESQSGQVNLTTTEISVMRLCLEFIYKGKIAELPIEIAPNLYVLGHVLKIPSLAKMCADLMIASASEDNYIPHLVLADEQNDYYLKCGLGDYISDNADLLKTEKWIKFSQEHPKAAVDVYQKCVFK